MSRTPILFGPIGGAGGVFLRSGLRWLAAEGQACEAGEPIAYCNIAPRDRTLFPTDEDDLQIVFTAPAAGRITHAALGPAGGYVDRLPALPWREAEPVAYIDTSAVIPLPRLRFLAGRRISESAEDRSGLMTGWHDRTRAWWGDARPTTLIGAGTCEQDALLRGHAFQELFDHCDSPMQIVLWQDEPLVPCALTLAQRMDRGPDEIAEIVTDLAGGLAMLADKATGQDLIFLGAILNALTRDMFGERYPTISRTDIHAAADGPRHLCLSLGAEFPHYLRHRRLGYALNCHGFRLKRLGPAARRWLRANFESVARTPENVRADYRRLVARLPARTNVIVLNGFSTRQYDDVTDYRAFGSDALDILGAVRARALNLMLHELAAEGVVEILDQDAIAARLGIAHHLIDGTHASGALIAAVRAELVSLIAPAGPARQPASDASILTRSGNRPASVRPARTTPHPVRR